MTPEERQEFDLLKMHMAHLQQRIDVLNGISNQDLAEDQQRDARICALRELIDQLAEQAGVTPEHCDRCYIALHRKWHDLFLRLAEDVSPAIGAALDHRTPEEADVSDAIPRLFDRPADGN